MQRAENFTTLYKQNKQSIKNYALHLTKNTNQAQDLAQESLLKAFKNFSTFRSNSSFKSWVFTILKNTFITNYHKRKRRGLVNKPQDELQFIIESNSAVKNAAIQNLRLNEIDAHLNTLPPKSQKPMKLYAQGYRYNEISSKLNIPMGTVKSRINYARGKLQQILNRS